MNDGSGMKYPRGGRWQTVYKRGRGRWKPNNRRTIAHGHTRGVNFTLSGISPLLPPATRANSLSLSRYFISCSFWPSYMYLTCVCKERWYRIISYGHVSYYETWPTAIWTLNLCFSIELVYLQIWLWKSHCLPSQEPRRTAVTGFNHRSVILFHISGIINW